MAQALFISTDLFFGSRVQAVGTEAGFQWLMRGAVIAADLDESISLVIVDLVTSKMTPAEIVEIVRGAVPSAKIVGFGPHVDHERLGLAREAGFDQVLTRAQFDGGLSDVFASAL